MHADDPPALTDRQARAVIIAAERLGFQREPDLSAAWYDHDLHDDAGCAARFLRSRDPDALDEALVADEPIPADIAAHHITRVAQFTQADAEIAIQAAAERGFTPPPGGLAVLPIILTFDQARAAVAFLWDEDPAHLADAIGELARIAPLPPSAWFPGQDLGCDDGW